MGSVVGVSFDSVEDNRAFAEKYDFPYPLLCDTDRAMSLAYGATVEGGKPYPDRISYIVDEQGVIAHAEEVGDINAHVQDVIARMQA